MNTRQTSKSVASKASKILSNPKSTKTLAQTKTGKKGR